ncbi:MAG: 16S rRNA processing protein RimM [Bacteroidales bacterium]|nr:16S rRNA processing protein RimM [Bacteroidales bacterium]
MPHNDTDKLVEIGRIQRAHGIKGELHVVHNGTAHELPEQPGWVFLNIDGIPTPFFAEQARQKSARSTIVKLRDIDSIESTQPLLGLSLLVPCGLFPQPNDDEIALADLVGYTLCTPQHGAMGTIVGFEDYGPNAVFVLRPHGGLPDALIPATDELIVEVDVEEQRLLMELPEGLLDL